MYYYRKRCLTLSNISKPFNLKYTNSKASETYVRLSIKQHFSLFMQGTHLVDFSKKNLK